MIFHCFAFFNAAVLLIPSLWLSSHYGTGLTSGGLAHLFLKQLLCLVSQAPCPSCPPEPTRTVASVVGCAVSSSDGHCVKELHNQSLLELRSSSSLELRSRLQVLCRKEALDRMKPPPHTSWSPLCLCKPFSQLSLAPPL